MTGAPGRATRALTGKDLEQRVTEYSGLYTQVLLGLHEDAQEQNRKLDAYGSELEELKRRIATLAETQDVEVLKTRLGDHDSLIQGLASLIASKPETPDPLLQARTFQEHKSQLEALNRQVASLRKVRILAAAALVTSLMALGGAVWAIL